MRILKTGVSIIMAAAMLAVLVPTAGAIFISFGDSSFTYGTALDGDGNQTVCSDGFELLAASTPNGEFQVGDPTGNVAGEVLQSPTVGVFDAALLAFDLFALASFTTPDGFDLVDATTLEPVAANYGFTSIDIILEETFFALDPSDPPVTKPAEGVGSTMFMPTEPLPVGQDVVIVVGDYPTYGSHRLVTVVDCSPPIDITVTIQGRWVRPDLPNKKLHVNVINDATFDITTVGDVLVGGAQPISAQFEDVDDDGDQDLALQVRTGDTTVVCGDTSITVSGTTDGAAFETVVPIETKCNP